jgi:hypothetical protein
MGQLIEQAALLATRRLKETAIILLVLLLALQSWKLNRRTIVAQELATKIQGLPPGTRQVVTVYRDHVVTKWRDGPTKIEYRDRYLPPEGHVEVVSKVDQPEQPPEVVVQDKGSTMRLGGGLVYSGKLLPMVDIKWAYWRRYSLTVGVTPSFGGIGLSRHIDDLTPVQNLEVQGVTGLGWDARLRFGIGLRTDF